LYGAVTLDPAMPLRRRAGAAAMAHSVPRSMRRCLARLDLKPGTRLSIGNATIEVAAVLQNEPDKLASGLAFAPA